MNISLENNIVFVQDGTHRTSITPLQDFSTHPQDVQDFCLKSFTPEVIAAYKAQCGMDKPQPNPRIAQIKIELAMIDSKSIRAIRSNDTVRLAEYEAQATLLRDELATTPEMVQP